MTYVELLRAELLQARAWRQIAYAEDLSLELKHEAELWIAEVQDLLTQEGEHTMPFDFDPVGEFTPTSNSSLPPQWIYQFSNGYGACVAQTPEGYEVMPTHQGAPAGNAQRCPSATDVENELAKLADYPPKRLVNLATFASSS